MGALGALFLVCTLLILQLMRSADQVGPAGPQQEKKLNYISLKTGGWNSWELVTQFLLILLVSWVQTGKLRLCVNWAAERLLIEIIVNSLLVFFEISYCSLVVHLEPGGGGGVVLELV